MRSRARSAVLLLPKGPAGSVPEEQKTPVVPRPEGGGMLHPLRAAARVIDQKIGWNRLGLALSLVIIGTAGVVLYRILRDIAFAEVVEALRATEWRDILLAAPFVAAGDFTLTFYDLFALRTIGGDPAPHRLARGR